MTADRSTGSGQVHITHRADYLRGRRDGRSDALADRDYRPRGAATGTLDQQRAYGLGYEDGSATAQDEEIPDGS